jgi:hypothetical protein
MGVRDVFAIAAAVIGSLGGGAVLVFAFSSWLGKVWAERIAERERAAFARELEALRHTFTEELERQKSELERQSFEHQTRFTWYHQKKAELIAEIYKSMTHAIEYVKEMVSPMQMGDEASRKQRAEETIALYNELAIEYYGKKIFLEKRICDKVESILNTIKTAITDWRLSQSPGFGGASGVRLWDKAFKSMVNEIPPLLTELEAEFRTMLSSIGPAA